MMSSPLELNLGSASCADVCETKPHIRSAKNTAAVLFLLICHFPFRYRLEVVHRNTLRRRAVLLLRPRRDHAIAARVCDRLPQMLVLIFENEHERALLRHISS